MPSAAMTLAVAALPSRMIGAFWPFGAERPVDPPVNRT